MRYFRWAAAMLSRKLTSVGVLGLVVTGVAVSLFLSNVIDLGDSPGTPGGARPGVSYSGGFSVVDVLPYCQEEPQPLVLLGRLAFGYTINSLTEAGFQAAQAVEGTEDDLIILQGEPRSLEVLEGHPALANVGWLRAQSTDPSLRSCDHRLADKPAASETGARATEWMVENGIVTQAEIDAGGTTFQLAEDPTNPEHLFFTVLLAKPTDGIPGPGDAASISKFMATIDKASGAVLGAGRFGRN